MARPTFRKHPKFALLCHLLGQCRPHCQGYCEFLWEAAYESGDPILGNDLAVELLAEFPGKRGSLVAALVEVGLLDRLPDGRLEIHDFWHHCPDYVYDRFRKEEGRKNKPTPRARKTTAKWREEMAATRGANPPAPDAPPEAATCQAVTPVAPPPELDRSNSELDRSNSELDGTPAPAPAPTPNKPPLPPLGGQQVVASRSPREVGAEPAVTEKLDAIRGERPVTASDRPELLPVAREILAHYKKAVDPGYAAKNYAASVVIALVAAGHAPPALKNAADGYADLCRSADVPRNKRQAAHTFYSGDGSYAEFLDWKPARRAARASDAPPPTPREQIFTGKFPALKPTESAE